MIIKKEKTSFFLKLAIMLLLFFAVFFFSNEIKNIFFYISSPIQKIAFDNGRTFYGVTEVVFDLKDIKEEIKDLRSENAELSAKLAFQRDVLKENEALKKALDLDLKSKEEFIFSEVVSTAFPSEYILINHGEKAGVEEDFSVITPEGAVVGSVVEVYSNFSKVMLVTSEDSSFEAKAKDSIGLLTGGEDLVLEMLPKDADVKEGDLVTTFSQSELHPRGLFIGTVTEVLNSDVEAFMEAKVRPGFYLQDLDFLFILKK